jgi:RNA polymerase sigma factor (TIGR02999 family)
MNMNDGPQQFGAEAAAPSVESLPASLDATPPESVEDLVSRVYDQLRRMAQQLMSQERPDHTLQATALVHEVYVRLLGSQRVDFCSRSQFFHAAAEAMRRILIERGRERRRLKRGGPDAGRNRIPLECVDLAAEVDGDDILELDQAITQLEAEQPDVAAVVRLRFFAGLGIDETAQVLNISPRTVNREWTYARAWLFRRLGNPST